MIAFVRNLWSKESLITAGVLLLSALMGFAAASGKLLVVALLGGALGTLALVAKPSLIFWTATVVTLVVAGMVKYFVPTLDRIWWLAYGMAFLLYLPAMLHVLNRKTAQRGTPIMMSIYVSIFMVDLVMASIAATSALEQIAVATKTLIMFSGMWVYFAFAEIDSDTVWKWLKLLLWIGCIQWVLAIWQYFFVRSARQMEGHGSVSAADSVVGTFGGSMEAGGLTAVLAFFLVSGIVLLIAMRSENVLSRKQLWVYGLMLFFPLIFMEVKIIFVYLPLAIAVLFRAEILRRPHVFIGWACLGIVALVGMLVVYQTLHWSVRGGNLQDNLTKVFGYSFEEQSGHDASEIGVMTRRETLEFWWRRHNISNFHEALIGHGLGASRTRGLFLGDMAERYKPWQIDRTGMAQFLWDFGLIGTLAVVGALYSMYSLGARLGRSIALLPWQRGLARGLQAIAPLYFLSLLYRNDIPYAAPMMFLFMSSFGLIAWLNRQQAAASPKKRQA